jgi:NAD(P)-dependent dehydrogenase (short-subunit alcohol dehydrogenase family)
MKTTSENKIVLITGANKGIGFEAARQIGRQGATVLIGARDKARGEAAAAALRKESIKAEFFAIDVTDDASVVAAAKEIAAMHSRLDVLVNNAGVNVDLGKKPSDLSIAALHQTLATNLDGVIRTTIAFLPLLKKSADGRIINVSSTWGSITAMSQDEPAAPAYHISKAALNMWTAMLAGELRGQAVTVNSICPGWVRTDMGGAAAPRSVQQGAAIIAKLATQAERVNGGFFDDAGTVAW